MTDEYYMRKALSLAQKGKGKTSPNPMVGAVLVKDDCIIGEGYHPFRGAKHAEIIAIESCRENPKKATLYTTLEPCCHSGIGKINPPCTERIVKEGIGKVVIGALDRNPKVSGKGIAFLKSNGIEVSQGILQEEADRLNEAYNHFMVTGLPFVHLKIAQTLDGRIATDDGDSKWITDTDARIRVHSWRAEHDAVFTGIGTVLADNPSLTVRHVQGKQPKRIVLDSSLKIPVNSKLVSDAFAEKTHIFFAESVLHTRCSKIAQLKSKGVKMHPVCIGNAGRLPIRAVLKELVKIGVVSILVEAGSKLCSAFLEAGLVQRVSFFIAPLLLGSGFSSYSACPVSSITQAIRFEDIVCEHINNQMLFQGIPQKRQNESCLPD